MTVIVRPVTLDDAEAYAALRRVVSPYEVVTPVGVRHGWQTATEAAKLLVLVAELDGEVVGAGRAGFKTWTSEVGAASTLVLVHPGHRGRGIGGRLYDAAEEHLRDHGAKRTMAWVVNEPESLAWCARRGFVRSHELRYSKLDLTDLGALPPTPPLPDGVTVATFAETGPEALYPVDAATVLDEPGDVTSDAVSYEDWLTDIWQGPENDYEASTVVLVDGVPAAYTLVETDHETHRMWSGGTGTVREHRGRGLAKIAKSIALRRAAEAGITVAYTSNDEVNQPMLAINEWLGYRACATQWSYVKTMDGVSGG
jgi:GNAT superfamily N-acetyltransferase